MSNGTSGTMSALPSSGFGASGVPPFDLFQYGFDASWEVDLWGRVRRSVESADASLTVSAESRRQMLVTSLAELARDYIQFRGQQRDLKIAQDTLASDQQSLRLTQQRAAGGLVTQLDVANAATQVQTTAGQIPSLENQAAISMNALALLLGETPGALTETLSAPQPVPPVPPRRPDRPAVGPAATPPRHSPGRRQPACRHRRDRRRRGGFLPEGHPERQRRPASAAVQEPR